MKHALMLIALWFLAFPAFAVNTLLVVGDSISAGYGIDPNQGWVSLLQQRLAQQNSHFHVVNDSISGDTTSDGLSRLTPALKEYQPTITIIELGGNDGLRGLAISTINNNLQQMITQAKRNHSEVLLLGVRLPPNYGALYTQQFQQVFTVLAAENHILVVPLLLQGVDDKPQLMQSDGIHPVTQAQIILLNNVWPTLDKLLKSQPG